MVKMGTGDGKKETIRKAFKKLTNKQNFEKRWSEKFLDNWEGCIGENDKIVLRLFA